MLHSMQRFLIQGCIGLFTLGLASGVYALDCDRALTQVDMNECAYLDFKKADQRLNQLYQQHRQGLDDQRKQQLKVAQQAWLKFRDLSCTYEADFYRGGSMVPLVRQGCLTEATENRIKALENYIEMDGLL
ncbi:MAG: lysozyme inhibitor LprI family protein [Neisseriaceae bacterium]